MNPEESLLETLIETANALCAKIKSSIMDGNPEGAERYAGALSSVCSAIRDAAEASNTVRGDD